MTSGSAKSDNFTLQNAEASGCSARGNGTGDGTMPGEITRNSFKNEQDMITISAPAQAQPDIAFTLFTLATLD
jgi:hypothetical protein